MRLVIFRFARLLSIAVCCFFGPNSTTQADPLTTFTVTDLGPGSPTFATGASGGIVIAADGQTAFPFPVAQATSLSQQQLLSSQIPGIAGASTYDSPDTYGIPANAYSTPMSAITNGQGTYVSIDAYGVYGHWGNADVYSVSQDANGTWGTPTLLWSGAMQYTGMPQSSQTSITGINSLGEILGAGALQAAAGGNTALVQPYLYNLHNNSLLDLYSLNVLQAGGWDNLQPIAIDNQGRILLEATQGPASAAHSEHTLLLTPEGVSAAAVTAPEPGALALGLLTIVALALRRAHRGHG